MQAPAWAAGNDAVSHVLDIVLSSRPGMLQRWADRLGVSHQSLAKFRTGEARLYVTDVALMEADDCVAFLTALSIRRGAIVAPPPPPMKAAAHAGVEVSQAIEAVVSEAPLAVRLKEVREAHAATGEMLRAVEAES